MAFSSARSRSTPPARSLESTCSRAFGMSFATSSCSRSTPGPQGMSELGSWQFGHSLGTGVA